MRLVQAGIILTFVGAGLFIATFLIPVMQGDQAKEVMALLIFSGTVAISMAVGLWVTALVTALWERRTGGSEGDQV
jgi:cobalamin synthase